MFAKKLGKHIQRIKMEIYAITYCGVHKKKKRPQSTHEILCDPKT